MYIKYQVLWLLLFHSGLHENSEYIIVKHNFTEPQSRERAVVPTEHSLVPYTAIYNGTFLAVKFNGSLGTKLSGLPTSPCGEKFLWT